VEEERESKGAELTAVVTGTDDGEIVEPEASALVESLRAFGYTTQAAIADLIDNSISAGARTVWIQFHWAGPDSHLTIRDDGGGMSPTTLKSAMRPGSQSPLAERASGDLGRFGLGLKTASFSQCRVLTVASRSGGGEVATRRWDLDAIARTRKWLLMFGVEKGSEDLASPLQEQETGTVVIWQRMDRIVDASPITSNRAHRRFLELADSVEAHLAMVFHRFLERGLAILINDRRIRGWDPFLSSHPATQTLPEEPLAIRDQRITIRGYILPHHSRLTEDGALAAAGGPAGWTAQQGFYVYRGGRMLVAGSWLGLGFQKADQYRLARLAVDLPNTVDHDWDIDVRKSRARPPGVLHEDLKRLARLTRERALDVFRHRGKALARATSEDYVFVWQKLVLRGKIRYQINRSHPLIASVLAGRADPTAGAAMLRLVEETLPTSLIALDSAEYPEQQRAPFENTPNAEFQVVMEAVYRSLRGQDLSPLQVRTRLLNMELFRESPELIDAIDDDQVMGA